MVHHPHLFLFLGNLCSVSFICDCFVNCSVIALCMIGHFLFPSENCYHFNWALHLFCFIEPFWGIHLFWVCVMVTFSLFRRCERYIDLAGRLWCRFWFFHLVTLVKLFMYSLFSFFFTTSKDNNNCLHRMLWLNKMNYLIINTLIWKL